MQHNLIFRCHARPPESAQVEFVIDDCAAVYQVAPTINWVMGSTARGSESITIPWPYTDSRLVEFVITARNSDVIVCAYDGCWFNYASQPVWSNGSSFMDITGHGSDQDLQGPGSLVLPQDVTCRFTARVTPHQNG
jgi:hypothetical protein